jgi:uncharacterized protein (DUF1330 family)
MIVRLVGMHITDPDLYAEYRRQMTPLLEQHGGSFGVDVWVQEVLRSSAEEPFNRLFTIQFPDEEKLEAFFAHPEYKAIRDRYFEPAVASFAELGRFEEG